MSHTLAPRPFFEAANDPSHRRRLLLVSWSFPPDSNIGALRWQKFIEHASHRGWGADVIMMDPTEAVVRDDTRLSALPGGTRLFGIPLPEHPWLTRERRLRALLRGLRRAPSTVHGADRGQPAMDRATDARAAGNLVTGSVRALRREYLASLHHAHWLDWASRAATVGSQLVRQRAYQAVVSSGPPHMAHEAARRIATAAALPLVLDFRDPWTAAESAPRDMQGMIWRAWSSRLERRCLEAARVVSVTTEAIARDLTRGNPGLANRLITVMNGADPDIASASALAPVFTIAQAGALYGGRDPRLLFRATARLVQARDIRPAQLKLHFVGDTDYAGQSLSSIAAEEGVAGYLTSEPARPRKEAIRVLQSAAVLVLLPQELHHCIPGKTFEYVQFAAWLLVLTMRDSATELLLRGTGALVVEPSDVDGITRALSGCYDAFVRGERPAPINHDGRFDRARHADVLFDALDRLSLPQRAPVAAT